MLLAVPNVSEGSDKSVVDRLAGSFAAYGAKLLDVHSDADHNRSVFTLAGEEDKLIEGVVSGAEAAVSEIDMNTHSGLHPCIGALDVVPIVYLGESDRHDAEQVALRLADRIANELLVPVFLYGDVATSEARRQRSFFRNGGYAELERRMTEEGLTPDAGPNRSHKTAGATLVTARPPLVAFNLELGDGGIDEAMAIAESLRESNGGLTSVRAIGLYLPTLGRAQVSINLERTDLVLLREVVEAAEQEASSLGASIDCAEIVGLVPEVSLEGFPAELRIRGFDADRQILERRITALG